MKIEIVIEIVKMIEIENSEDDSEDDRDRDEIDSEMQDFIVDDDEPIEYESSNSERSPTKQISKYEYAKFLNKLFPSSYSRDKINQIKRRRLLSPKSSNNNLNHILYINTDVLNNKHSRSFSNIDSDRDIDDDNDSDSDTDSDDDYNPDNSKLAKKNKKGKGENNINKLISKNYNEYKKIFDVKSNEESKYFKNSLSIDEQKGVIEKLKTIKDLTTVKKPYLIYLAELDIPDIYKACAINKINLLSNMDENSANSEYYKLKLWIDSFIKIPFNRYTNIPVHVSDGLEKCNDFITEAKHILDRCVFGLETAKMQILQLIGLWIVNPESIGTSISLKGPMGVGKTTLIKDGISKILNRYFTLIPLGGANDISHFEGHGYTYEGSTYGKIIDILIQAKQMNPIIYFDELDKVSDTPKGDEVIGLLTHLTDTTQNNCYHDKYFSEIDFDLSKILYIFSYNDETKINPILRDRMYNIELKGYTVDDKLSISKQYLLPKIRNNINFSENDIVFDDTIMKYIIIKYTEGEEGVRNLKRCYEIIYTKLNLLKLLKSDNKEMYKLLNINTNTIIPLTLTTEIIDKLLYKKQENSVPFGMYN